MTQLFNTDFLTNDIPSESVDLVVTDPPYKIVGGGSTTPKGGVFDKAQNTNVVSGKLFNNNAIEFSEWLPEIYRVLKNGTHAYIMCNGRNIAALQDVAEQVGFVFQNLLVWDKGRLNPNRYYMMRCEFILMLRKGKARTINYPGMSNMFSVPNKISKRLHPTEKPVGLMEIFIQNSSNARDTVLDPFMGAGSTGVASVRLGRHFIGYEIDEKYFDIARGRIEVNVPQ